MRKFNSGSKLNLAIIIIVSIALVCVIIRPLYAFGGLLALAGMIMCAIQAISNARKRKRGKPVNIASVGKMSLGAGKLAIAAFVVFVVAVSLAPPTTNTTADTQADTITATKEADAAKKKAEQAKKEAEEEQAKAEQEKASARSKSTVNSSAIDTLNTLPIKGRAPKTGYSRAQFGAAWSDVDHNGCDTRNDILNRDLTSITYKPGTHNCVVLTGTLADPYTGSTIQFQRGQSTSSKVQIDHVVALSNAWQTGAQQLAPATRLAFANDPYNLLAVDGPANQQKSDGDAATWLPSNKSYRCQYVARQIGVKAKYSLWVTQAEHDAMANVLSTCPSQTIPDGSTVDAQVQQQTQQNNTTPAPVAPQQQATPQPEPQPAAPQQQDVYYANCAAVKAAGKAPLYRDQPGYSSKLDRDGDGVACEK